MDGEVGKELGGREGDIKKGHEETLRSAVFIMLIIVMVCIHMSKSITFNTLHMYSFMPQ